MRVGDCVVTRHGTEIAWADRPMLAFDLETHLILPGLLAPPIVCGSFAAADGSSLRLRDDALSHLRRALADPELAIVGHNIAYDFGCVCAHDPSFLVPVFEAYDAGRVFDTGLAQALIDISEGSLFVSRQDAKPIRRYSLAYCESIHLGIDRSEEKHGPDAWRLRYAELDGVPLSEWPEAARAYPLADAQGTLGVARAQIVYADARGGSNLHAMSEAAGAAWALHLSAVWGLRTDPATVTSVSSEIESTHVDALAKFQAVGLFRKDGTKDTVLLARMVAQSYGAEARCGKCGGTGKVISDTSKRPVNCPFCGGCGRDISAIPQTDGGKVRCDRDALRESGDETLESFAAVGENEKWRSTYLPVLRQGAEAPITPSINTLVATGRTSYSSPNLQNLPRGGHVRECFVPRPGHLFASVDYGGLELVTLAQVCLWQVGESAMADALNGGRDLHNAFAARLRSITYEEQVAQAEARDKTAKNFRQLAKAPNFGLPGGLGAAKLVAYARQSYGARFCELAGRAPKCGVEKTIDPRSGKPVCSACLEVAKELRTTWFETFPEVREYHRIIKGLTEGPMGGAVEVLGPPGELPGRGLVRGACGFCDGANLGFQGLAARGAKAALYAVTREAYTDPSSPLWGARPVVFIHDEILAEVPEATAHEAAMRISEVMVATMRRYTPDVAVTAPPALMRRWLKGAEPVYVAGKLVPWEPSAKGA